MKKLLQPAFLLALALGSVVIVGCGSPDYPADYKAEVKKSDKDKAREAELMKGQKMPGTADLSGPITGTAADHGGGK